MPWALGLIQMGQFHRNKNQRGETLVESLLALAVATVIATGIVIAVVTALSGTTNNQNSNFAGNYAQEGSNLVKDLAATDFTSFQSTYVYNSSDTSKNVYNFGDDQTLTEGMPAFWAKWMSSVTVLACIFCMTRPRWTLIVCRAVPRLEAICLFSIPLATR